MKSINKTNRIDTNGASCYCGGALRSDSAILVEKKLHHEDDVIGRIVCSNGHSFFIRKNTEGVVKAVTKITNEWNRRSGVMRNRLPRVPEGPPKVIHYTGSVICVWCRKRVYNAHPRQKYHPGRCLQKAQALRSSNNRLKTRFFNPTIVDTQNPESPRSYL